MELYNVSFLVAISAFWLSELSPIPIWIRRAFDVVSVPPIDCAFCMSFWIGGLLALFTCCSFLTPIVAGVMVYFIKQIDRKIFH